MGEVIRYKLNLDTNYKGCEKQVNLIQGEVGARGIEVTLTAGADRICLNPVTDIAVMRGLKPSGKISYNSAVVNEDGTVGYVFTEQDCASSGSGWYEIQIFRIENKIDTSSPTILYSAQFKTKVEGTLYQDTQVTSSNEYTELQNAIVEVRKLPQTLQNEVDSFMQSAQEQIDNNCWIETDNEVEWTDKSTVKSYYESNEIKAERIVLDVLMNGNINRVYIWEDEERKAEYTQSGTYEYIPESDSVKIGYAQENTEPSAEEKLDVRTYISWKTYYENIVNANKAELAAVTEESKTSIEAESSAATNSINALTSGKLEDINNTAIAQLDNLNTVAATQIEAINNTAIGQINAIGSTADAQMTAINETSNNQLNTINETSNNQLNAINTTAKQQSLRISELGTELVNKLGFFIGEVTIENKVTSGNISTKGMRYLYLDNVDLSAATLFYYFLLDENGGEVQGMSAIVNSDPIDVSNAAYFKLMIQSTENTEYTVKYILTNLTDLEKAIEELQTKTSEAQPGGDYGIVKVSAGDETADPTNKNNQDKVPSLYNLYYAFKLGYWLDQEMSDDSTNFVQNKVIKQYVDMLVKELKDNQDNYVPTSRQIGSVSLDDDITLEKLGGMVTNAFSAGGSWMSTLVPFMQMYCGSKTQQDDNTTAISELTEAQEKKLDIAQGEDNANKNVVTDDEGNVTTEDVQTIPTVLDTIEITEECTGALTFSNIQEYFKRYKKLKIFAIMPYTETNTETAQIYVAGHSLATFNASSCWVYYSSKGQQTTKRVSRLYFELEKVFSENKVTYYEGRGYISSSTAYTAYNNGSRSGAYPDNSINFNGSYVNRYLSVYTADTWAVGTKVYLLGMN